MPFGEALYLLARVLIMKSYKLKIIINFQETLANIGTAYDNLHKELKGLVEITKKRHFPIRYGNIQPEHTCNALPKYTLDRRRLHDIQVKALLLAKSTENDKIAKANKTTEKHVRMDNKNLEAILKDINQVKNATTITRYPPKSTGVGHQEHDQCSVKETCRYRNPVCDRHQCYKDYEQCQVQNQHLYNNWKY